MNHDVDGNYSDDEDDVDFQDGIKDVDSDNDDDVVSGVPVTYNIVLCRQHQDQAQATSP